MTQKRLRNFKHPILSFEHNLYNLGLHSPGRYVGFDTFVPTGGLAFQITHANSGITYKDPANSVIGPYGLLCTPQGTLIMEDDSLDGEAFVIQTNAGNTEVRYDLLIFTHSQIQNTGGQPGIYSVLKGPVGNPIFPTLSDPLKQIIVGIIEIPAGATNSNAAIWTKAKCPDSGDGEDARLYENNIFRGFQGFNSSGRQYQTVTTTSDDVVSGQTVHSYLWELDGDANLYQLLPGNLLSLDGIKLKNVPLQDGLNIKLLINDKVSVRSNFAFVGSMGPKGYRPIWFNENQANFWDPPLGGQNNYGIKPPTSQYWVLDLLYVNNSWWLMSIDNRPDTFQKWRQNTQSFENFGSAGLMGSNWFNWRFERNWCHINFIFDYTFTSIVPNSCQFRFLLGQNGQPPKPATTGNIYSGSGQIMKQGQYNKPALLRVSSILSSGDRLIYDCSEPLALGLNIVQGSIMYEVDIS